MQGSMTIKRSTIWRVGLTLAAALATAAAVPITAQASSLLSGYGGPGQGSQVLLGSTLIGGPGGGSPGAAAPVGSGAEASSQSGNATGGSGGPARTLGGKRGHSRGTAGALQATASAPGAPTRFYPAVEVTSGASDVLGLSGSDILYIVLAAVALVFTGALTKLSAVARAAKSHR
jgi:hypothetical protein